MKQNIVIFVEPSKEKWRCPFKIGRLYMNRFAIDENDQNEILSVVELTETLLIPPHCLIDDHMNLDEKNVLNAALSSKRPCIHLKKSEFEPI